MKIFKENKVSDVQNQFAQQFPELKLKFYKVAHHDHEGNPKKDEVADTTLLVDLNSNLQNDEVVLNAEMTVSELESMFEDKFGLHVQVFRHSGSTWLQTSTTDHWTLAKQIEKAKESIH